MSKTRIYLIQLIGIIMLLCGYLMRDQPDRLSTMHFDPNPAQQTVISKAVRLPKSLQAKKTAGNTHHGRHHRSKAPRQVVFNIAQVHITSFQRIYNEPIVYTILLRENYDYLFYREINPPPPRSC